MSLDSNANILGRRAALGLMAGTLLSPTRISLDDEAEREFADVRKIATEVGIANLQVHRLDRYQAIGDAPRAFLKRATELCRDLSRDFLRDFREKKFAVETNKGLMTLVVLSSRSAFNKYLGIDLGPEIAGVYEPDTNRLVLFDNRAGGRAVNAGRTNTVVLFHEATHQLSFSTGLLEPQGDIPLAIAEGIANYGEVRTIDGKTKVGAVNRERLAGLFPRPGQRVPELIPVSELITQDSLLEADETKQHAYSQCWLLVHCLMKTQDRLPQFRAYLDTIRARRDPQHRLQDWITAFGPTEMLDNQLKAYAISLL